MSDINDPHDVNDPDAITINSGDISVSLKSESNQIAIAMQDDCNVVTNAVAMLRLVGADRGDDEIDSVRRGITLSNGSRDLAAMAMFEIDGVR